MEVSYESSKQLARCFLTKLTSNIHMPDEIITSLTPLGKNVVAVIPGESKKMTFFLTNATQILFVRLFLNKEKLDDSFFTSLRGKMKELNMTNLFSTGICFKQEICVWEGVFEFDDANQNKIVEEKFSQVLHVKKTKFEIIKLMQ
jgi:hypothetical protein